MCGPNHWAPIAGTHHEIKDASSPQTAGAEERSEPLKCLGGFVHGHLTGMESQNELLELPIRICATSSERAIRSCLSKPINRESTPNQRRTSPRSRPSPVVESRQSLGGAVRGEVPRPITNKLAPIPKISPTKRTTRLVASTRRGTTSRGLDGGPPRRRRQTLSPSR